MQEYEALLSSWPALRDVAPPESGETLDEAERQRRLSGAIAGINAPSRRTAP